MSNVMYYMWQSYAMHAWNLSIIVPEFLIFLLRDCSLWRALEAAGKLNVKIVFHGVSRSI